MALKFSAANVVYIRNLSQNATEASIRELLSKKKCEDGSDLASRLVRIDFRLFPLSSQRYCQLEFTDSTGVTMATQMNGEMLQGVPLAISVMDPAHQASSPALLSQGDASSSATLDPATHVAQQAELLNVAIQNQLANAQAVQLASIQARQLAEHKRIQLAASGIIAIANPGIVGSEENARISAEKILGRSNLLDSYDAESQILARTIHVSNIPPNHMAHDVQTHLESLEGIVNLRVDTSPSHLLSPDALTNRFAVVEFSSEAYAEAALARGHIIVEDRKLQFSPAKVTVLPVDPSNVRFDISLLPPIPVAYQQVHRMKMEEKYARVVSMEPALSKRILRRARAVV